MTQQQPSLLAALNGYQGDNVWEDVIYPHPEYHDRKTDAVEHGGGDYFATTDGTVYRLEVSTGTWSEAGTVADYATAVRIEWSVVKRYAAVINLHRYGLTKEDFPLGDQELSHDVAEVLADYQGDGDVIEVDGLEIHSVEEEK